MKKILVVDDEKIIAKSIARVLEKETHELVVCFSGIEAIESLKNNKFDIAILDLLIIDFSGDELLSWIQKNSPETKTIMITAYSDPTTIEDLYHKGATLVVKKPFEDIFAFKEIVEKI